MNQKHKSHHEHMIENYKRRFWISFVLSLPIIVLSPHVQSLLHISLTFPGDKWILLILATVLYVYGGQPFLKGLVQEITRMCPGMMTLVGIAITVAYAYSVAVTFGLTGELFFWELATLIDVMLLGHWIEMRSVIGASKALEKLAQLLPSKAHVIRDDGSLEDIALSDLKKGDKVLVRPGEKVSADGIVLDGESEVNEAALTGESKPIFKHKGSSVIGGSLNAHGSLIIEVKKDQKETYVAQVIELVSRVMESKSHAQDVANKAAFALTIIALLAGGITFIAWILLFSGTLSFALERTVTVMVTACPHALGLAIPLVIAVITSLAAQKGLLIRNRIAFEQAKDIDMVVFDKTGTLTYGTFEITEVISLGKMSRDEIVRLAASIEEFAQHSIAKAIVLKAKQENLALAEIERPVTVPGKGILAKYQGATLLVGTYQLLIDQGFQLKDLEEPLQKLEKLNQKGKTAVFVAMHDIVQGIIAASDVIRKESYIACKNLQKRGIVIAMITGDNRFSALAVAQQLGIENVFSEVLPAEKSEKIKSLQLKYAKVAMVGDGINDAPALAAANIGIAIGAGTDVAIETADIILVKNDPRNVIDIIDLSKITYRKTIQNLLWATGYNIVALPLAAGLLYNYGIMINPAVGALLMSVSTVIVALNSRFIAIVPN